MRILRAAGAGLSEMRSFFPRLLGIFRQLFNEVIGFVFFALALFFAFGANGLFESLKAFQAAADAEARSAAFRSAALAALPVAVLAWFGISNFMRARAISRKAAEKDS